MRKRQIQVRAIRGIILVKMNSVDIVKTEADMSMLNTSISVGKINEKETSIQVRVIQE